MNTTKKRNFVIGGILLFIILQFIAVLSALLNYNLLNILFYFITIYFSIKNLFSPKKHCIIAVIWSILTIYLLGNFFGGMILITYWGLYVIKKNTSPDEPNRGRENERGTIKRFARVPFVRIPIPWVIYTLDLENAILTRDSLFPERDKSNGRRDFIGKDDDLPLKQVFDWSFSTKLWRKLAGTSCFEFQSKKIGRSGDKKTHWHNLPNELITPLRSKLIELQ